MSSFLEIRNVVAKEIDLDECCHKHDRKFFLASMYFAQLVYFRWSFVEKSIKTLPGYQSHSIYDVDGVQALIVEFRNAVWVAFRGTEMKLNDWATISKFWQGGYGQSEAHQGFIDALEKIKKPMLEEIMTMRVKGKKIVFCGHSMGGALATLLCVNHRPYACCVFGSPKVMQGNYYRNYFQSFPFIRFEMEWDFVTHIPVTISFIMKYQHVGKSKKMPAKFKPLRNHFINSYLRHSLNLYYTESTGLDTCFAHTKMRYLKSPYGKI